MSNEIEKLEKQLSKEADKEKELKVEITSIENQILEKNKLTQQTKQINEKINRIETEISKLRTISERGKQQLIVLDSEVSDKKPEVLQVELEKLFTESDELKKEIDAQADDIKKRDAELKVINDLQRKIDRQADINERLKARIDSAKHNVIGE